MTDYPLRRLFRFSLCGGLFFAATISVLLVVCVTLNVPVSASKEASAPQDARVPAQDQQLDSAPDKLQQTKLQLTDGTPVRLKFAREVVSSQVIAGEKISLEVVEPVLVGKLVAIPQHSVEEAIVTMAQAGRSMGRGGNLQLKIESVRLADGELVPVRAVKDVTGGGRQAAAVIANLTVWPFQVKGKNASVPAGTEITAYIAGDFPLDASKFRDAAPSPQEKNDRK